MSGFKTEGTEVGIDAGLAFYQGKAQAAVTQLIKKGFMEPRIPMMSTDQGMQAYQGTLPPDLTALTDDELGTLLGRLTEWSTYVGFQLAMSDSNLTAAKKNLEVVEAKLRIQFKYDEENKRRSNPERDDYVHVDKRYVEANGEVLYWETIYRYERAIHINAENAFASVSRRITQRGQDVERERRTGGVGNAMYPNGPVFGQTPPGGAYPRRG